ncbi:MAG TPA: DUF5723 family protein [Bacteroidia bacterium]|nr:DUF5723 family protein [Bacteroidia bacterium]
MKKLLLILGITAFTMPVIAQIDMGIPSAAGKGGVSTAMVKNWEAIGINPSNLGWSDNYKFSITLLNGGLTAQSKAIDFATLKHAMFHPSDTFTVAEKQNYANLFTNPDGFNMQANINWLATSIYFPKFGGLAFSVRDRAYAHVGLNSAAADILFNGMNSSVYQDSSIYSQNISHVFDGCNLTYLHFREANLTYGRRIAGFGDADADGNPAVQIYGGVGFKFIWGMANMNARIENGTILGQSSFSTNYSINYGNIQNFTPQKAGGIFNAVGTGTGIDLGTSVIIRNKFRFALAATDFGAITWKNNVLVASDTTMPHLDSTNYGLNSWQIGSQAGFLFANNGFMNYSPAKNYKSNLPSRLRFGFGMKIGERIDLGADIVLPMNKTLYNLSKPYFAVGADIKIFECLKVNVGVAGSGPLGFNIPLGITLGPLGPLEFGFATGDALTFVDKSKNPNLSFCVGILRLNIDPKLGIGADAPPTPGM